MSLQLDRRISETGTRFHDFPQPRFLLNHEGTGPLFSEPEEVVVDVPPEAMQRGPADDRMYVVEATGRVLDVEGVSTGSGAQVLQWEWHGGNNQRFRLEPVDDGYYRIVAMHSSKVLDVSGASTADGAPIVQWDWHGGDNQRFRL